MRKEKDSMGEIEVPDDKLWGAQTARSLIYFNIGKERMPEEIVQAIFLIKAAAASCNQKAGVLSAKSADAILEACSALMSGAYAEHFPLSVWQTGSGTQTNMNVNEVIAHLCAQKGTPVHANDHVNRSQSTNDVFPTAIHMAAAEGVLRKLLPEIDALRTAFLKQEKAHAGIIKTGRTHLQDATPILFSDEIGAWRAALETAEEMIEDSLKYVLRLPIGGTAVGSGINAPEGFGKEMVAALSKSSGISFSENKNKFHGLSSKDALLQLHGALKTLATGLMKIANDIRWLASGPRTGLAELILPANEPGSSIMPGKVNPTQCEALSMIAAEVMGNDVSLSVAASQGNFQLNVYMPLIGFKLCESIRLLSDGMACFNRYCVAGMRADEKKMRENYENSLMLATALTPLIGYDKSAQAVKKAHAEKLSLKESVVTLGFLKPEEFDAVMQKNIEETQKKARD